jgi:hypothetical protein
MPWAIPPFFYKLNSNLGKELSLNFIMNSSTPYFNAENGEKYIVILTGGRFETVIGGEVLYRFFGRFNVLHSIFLIKATSFKIQIVGDFNSVDVIYSKIIM